MSLRTTSHEGRHRGFRPRRRTPCRVGAILDDRLEDDRATLTAAEVRGRTGDSRKFVAPLLDHADCAGWIVRLGDERSRGGFTLRCALCVLAPTRAAAHAKARSHPCAP